MKQTCMSMEYNKGPRNKPRKLLIATFNNVLKAQLEKETISSQTVFFFGGGGN